MRVKLLVLALGLGLTVGGLGCATVPGAVIAPGEPAPSAFYDALAPYGAWANVAPYGWIWQPSAAVVGRSFVPYSTNGQWVYTDYGWAWQSFWNWGWACFHYGRWAFSPALGWFWVPGTVWAPAWVAWRYGGGFVGWAPLPPPGFGLGYDWAFVPVGAFLEPNPIHYAVPVGQRGYALTATQRLNREITHQGVHWPVGPSPHVISRQSRRPVVRIGVQPPRPGRVEPARPGVIGAHPGRVQIQPRPVTPLPSTPAPRPAPRPGVQGPSRAQQPPPSRVHRPLPRSAPPPQSRPPPAPRPSPRPGVQGPSHPNPPPPHPQVQSPPHPHVEPPPRHHKQSD